MSFYVTTWRAKGLRHVRPMTVYKARPRKEPLLVDSMHRFQGAISASPGPVSATTFKDRKTGRLVGIAVWADRKSMEGARAAMVESTKNDKFDEWLESEDNHPLDEI